MYFEQIPVDHLHILYWLCNYMVMYCIHKTSQNYPEECATALIPLFTCSKLSSTPNRDLRHVQLESPGGTGQVQIVNMDGENG